MENKAHFGSLTPRMQEYRESVLDQKPYIDAQRAVLATESYKKNLNQPAVMKRALMLQNILAKMDIYIEDETVLVGNQSSVNRGAPVFPEYTMKFILDELDLFEKRDGDVFYITEETKRQLREIAPFWENNNLRSRGEALIPEERDRSLLGEQQPSFPRRGADSRGDAGLHGHRILRHGGQAQRRRRAPCSRLWQHA